MSATQRLMEEKSITDSLLNEFEIVALGIVGSCNFTCNKRMEILDKNGVGTKKFTYNAKGTLYRKYNPEKDKIPNFRNVETGELYSSIYARILIKKGEIMKIEPKEILIKDLISGYNDSGEGGVVGYNGILDIRPPYQREFVYKDKQREDVINSIIKGFPLNSIYWVKNGDRYEVLDGQQRILSICQYANNEFSFKHQNFDGLPKDIQEKILNYKLNVYICEGNDSEKLEWFEIINIAGEKLTDQELRNAVYTGSWLSNAKTIFSKTNCAAYGLAKDYLNGSPIRQEFLERALKWISQNIEVEIKDKEKSLTENKIEAYMGRHQKDRDANEL